jgi:hypothetical protein
MEKTKQREIDGKSESVENKRMKTESMKEAKGG